LGREFAESRLVLQSAVLISRRQALVIVHPLLEVFLALRNCGRTVGRRTNGWSGLGGAGLDALGGSILLRRAASRYGFLPETAGESRPGGKQQNDCRANKEPG